MADCPHTCSLCPKSFGLKKNLNRHMLNHQVAKYPCETCNKVFNRTDYLSKHRTKCPVSVDDKTCDLCRKSFSKKANLKRHKKICELKHKEGEIIKVSDAYTKKIKRGELLEKILRKNPNTIEEALNRDDKESLKLYQLSCEENVDMNSVNLKPWQEKVIRFIDNPSERKIYWVIGERGNEGKTFIQKYIHKLFGSRRVLKSELNSRKVDIAYALSQESFTCKDIFLFNLLRSDCIASYGILENIKDGYLLSSKYRSKPLKIKTPNTVIVFSNSHPEKTQLSSDRWKVYKIQSDEIHTAVKPRRVDPSRCTKNYTAYLSDSE